MPQASSRSALVFISCADHISGVSKVITWVSITPEFTHGKDPTSACTLPGMISRGFYSRCAEPYGCKGGKGFPRHCALIEGSSVDPDEAGVPLIERQEGGIFKAQPDMPTCC